ncbi:hypothetical protein NDA18_004524 [Ustilago nuda]|nr:hypothetical protein NDA18_004524 [Ustilago nuda]
MKLNIAIVALALSSSVLTLAAPLPMPMPQGWGLLRKAVGKISGKSSSEAKELPIYVDEYVPYIPKELSPEASPVHRSHGGGDSSRSAERDSRHDGDESVYSTSPEASPVHRSHGGGDSSRSAERDSRHRGDESGHWTSPPDDYVGMVKLRPEHSQPQYTSHTPQPGPYVYPSHPQYTPQHGFYGYQSHPQYTPQPAHYDYPSQPQYTHQHAPNDYHSQHGGDESGHRTSPPDDYVGMVKLSPPEHYRSQYTSHTPQHAPSDYPSEPQLNYVTPHGHAWPDGPPGEIVPQQSSHENYGYNVREYLSRPPPEQNRVGWIF